MPHNNLHRAQAEHAFTLVELLVVIIIVSILITLLVPSLGAVMREARQTKCMANVRSLATATTIYLDQNSKLPFAHEYPHDITPWEAPRAVWECPDDTMRKERLSYSYVPGAFLQGGLVLPDPDPDLLTSVTRMYEQHRELPVIEDGQDAPGRTRHRGTRNSATLDTAVTRRANP